MKETAEIVIGAPLVGSHKYIKNIVSGHTIHVFDTLSKVENFVYNTTNVDLLILDNGLFHSTKDDETLHWLYIKQIPILFLANSSMNIIPYLRHQRIQFLIKPLDDRVITHQINKMIYDILYTHVNEEINRSINDRMKKLVDQIDTFDHKLVQVLLNMCRLYDGTYGKMEKRIRDCLRAFFKCLISTDNVYRATILTWDLEEHIHIAPICNIGKMFVPRNIVDRTAPELTDYEKSIFQNHVRYGNHIMNYISRVFGKNEYLYLVRNYIMYHHEHWDGHGYLQQRQGFDIPLEARIIHIINRFVMYHDPPVNEYNANSKQYVQRRLKEDRGKRFDPDLIDIFMYHYSEIENAYF